MGSTHPFQQLFDDQTCLIAEPSSAFSGSIKSFLNGLGLEKTKVLVSTNFENAIQTIESAKPRILICEFTIGSDKGLALVEAHEKLVDDALRIDIVLSSDVSDAAVAEAAEGQVDDFLVKPFSAEDFKTRLISIVEKKLFPSPYAVKIRDGKAFLKQGEVQQAQVSFQDAKNLSENPATACFYVGVCHRERGENGNAVKEFREGRAISPLHYQCIFGEFEALVAEKRFDEAHQLVPILIKNFPLTASRLRQIFIASVMSRKFEYLPEYFTHFEKLESRPVDLVKVVSTAFLAGGKWLFQDPAKLKANLPKANDFFEKAVATSMRDLSMFEKVILELVRVGAATEALAFLKKVPQDQRGNPVFNRLELHVGFLVMKPEQVLERGQKLAAGNELTADLLLRLVKLSAQNGKELLAESFISKALEIDSKLRDQCYKILQDNLVTRR